LYQRRIRRLRGMRRSTLFIILLAGAGLILAGCAGEDAEQAETQQTTTQQPGQPAAGQPTLQPDPGDPTVAVTVNGTEITKGQIANETNRLMRQMGGQGTSPQQLQSMSGFFQQQATDNLVSRILLQQAIDKEDVEVSQADIDERMTEVRSNFGSEEELQNRLAMMGMTEETLEQEMSTALKVEKLLELKAPVPEVTEAEVRAYYDENPTQFQKPERVRASHILFKVEEGSAPDVKAQKKAEADKILKELEAGADFGQLAAEHSDCPSASRAGDLGAFEKGRMVKPFEDTAWSLGVGEMSGVVETRFGYHIIKKTEHEEGGSVSFEESRDNLTAFLDGKKKQEAMTAYTEQLKAEADIKYMDSEE
jgi:peptidyl-prolyl cis-trans isomerase C